MSEADSTRTSLELAAAVQRAFIPTTCPTCEGSRMGARWVPHESVGGDFYALPAVAGRYRGIVMGDAVGHGLPAAILMAAMAGTIRGFSAFAHRPAHLLEQLNTVFAELTQNAPEQPDLFLASMFYGLLDVQSRRLRYANAGHPAAALRRKSTNETIPLKATGTLLGATEDGHFGEAEMPVEADDRLVLVTDGVLDARNPQREMFGTDRLLASIAEGLSLPPQPFADGLLAQADAFRQGEPADDDQTVLVIDFL